MGLMDFIFAKNKNCRFLCKVQFIRLISVFIYWISTIFETLKQLHVWPWRVGMTLVKNIRNNNFINMWQHARERSDLPNSNSIVMHSPCLLPVLLAVISKHLQPPKHSIIALTILVFLPEWSFVVAQISPVLFIFWFLFHVVV